MELALALSLSFGNGAMAQWQWQWRLKTAERSSTLSAFSRLTMCARADLFSPPQVSLRLALKASLETTTAQSAPTSSTTSSSSTYRRSAASTSSSGGGGGGGGGAGGGSSSAAKNALAARTGLSGSGKDKKPLELRMGQVVMVKLPGYPNWPCKVSCFCCCCCCLRHCLWRLRSPDAYRLRATSRVPLVPLSR
jgi:hypothetical protein